MTASSAPGATSTDKGPFLAELNHLSVPVKDLKQSIRLDPKVFAKRPLASKLAENFFRLFSPVL